MLQEHIHYILTIDPHFRKFWNELDQSSQHGFIHLAEQVESSSNSTGDQLLAEHKNAYSALKRKMVVVQQLQFQSRYMPKDWGHFVRDSNAKQECFDQTQNAFTQFAQRQNSGSDILRFYGNIKALESLRRKISFRAIIGTAIQKNEMDARDIIRFRFVVSSINELANVSVALWREYFDKVIGCHNFYFYPKAGDEDNHYRAVHFQIQTVQNRFAELQTMTQARELITFFDHALLFKRDAPFLNPEHEKWLRAIQLKANIYDAQLLSNGNEL